MIVGDRSRFAIEFELDQSKLAESEFGSWLFGKIRFWCCGEQIGRYEGDTTIRDIVIEAERFIASRKKRHDCVLATATSEEIVDTICNALYVDSGQTDEKVQADTDRYGPFVVSPEADVFDPWRMLLVEGDHAARLIWYRKDEHVLHECTLNRGEFEVVLDRFLAVVRDVRQR